VNQISDSRWVDVQGIPVVHTKVFTEGNIFEAKA
jgi:hypothetical protein